jgi:hypothetical protein
MTQKYEQKYISSILTTVIMLSLFSGLACGFTGQSVDTEATVAAAIAATRAAELNLQATIEAAVAATETARQTQGEQPPSSSTPSLSSPNIPDPEQVRKVILNEVNGAIAQDLALLKSLYAPEATVIDHHGTPDNPDDDTVWQAWANIERRYLAFFAAGFSSLTLVDLSIQMNGEQATGTHQGVVLDGTLYPDEGIYTLQKIEGQWLITQLEFGLVA